MACFAYMSMACHENMLHEFMVSFHTCMRAEAPAIAHLHLVMQEQNSKQTAVSQKAPACHEQASKPRKTTNRNLTSQTSRPISQKHTLFSQVWSVSEHLHDASINCKLPHAKCKKEEKEAKLLSCCSRACSPSMHSTVY